MRTVDTCYETRLAVGIEGNADHDSGSAIIRQFETKVGLAVVLTQPEKICYGGPPLPEILKEVVGAWSQIQEKDPEEIVWFCHFNRSSYFDIENAHFIPEFYRITVEGTESGAFASMGRRVSPEELARTLEVGVAVVYGL